MSTTALPSNQERWVRTYCWFFEFLAPDLRLVFSDLLCNFVNEIRFVGVGIEVTEEMRVAVGGWAILPILKRPLGLSLYTNIERIAIYPGEQVSRSAIGEMASGHFYCHVRLAWDDIRGSSTLPSEYRNTILHEFAHALDDLDRVIDGMPALLLTEDEKRTWKTTFNPDFASSLSLRRQEQLGQFFGVSAWSQIKPEDSESINVSELFACSTERFFETPHQLRKAAPEIFENLVMLYRINSCRDFPAKSLWRRISGKAMASIGVGWP